MAADETKVTKKRKHGNKERLVSMLVKAYYKYRRQNKQHLRSQNIVQILKTLTQSITNYNLR